MSANFTSSCEVCGYPLLGSKEAQDHNEICFVLTDAPSKESNHG